MRHLVILAAVVALAAAGPRERRQASTSGYTKCRGGNAECVPYYLCRDDKIITDGGGIIDIRLGPECPNFLDVCCGLPDVVDTTTTTTSKPAPITCGQRRDSGIDVRIQGFEGNETQVGEFNWMTAVLKKELVAQEEINLYLCGGSLIHPSIVLTAAHCVDDHSGHSLRVRLGEWDTQNEYEPYKHQDREVQKVVIHPGFNNNTLFNDFALLYLQTPADLTGNVGLICLDEYPVVQPGQYCVVTGWGKDRFGKKGVFQNVLKKIDLPVVDDNTCQNNLRTTRLGEYFRLHGSFVCAGGERGKDACSGDGGSPLVCLDTGTNRYVQAGIVAWGINCGSPSIPGVYADVHYGYNWIVTEADKLVGHPSVTTHWNHN